jgi:photosystem II stability/assembly factor-like uncharacterized protein
METGVTFLPESLAASRSNPDVLFMGGTDFSKSGLDAGVAMSKDGGRTWRDISVRVEPDPYFYISRMEIDPLDEDNVYALGIGGFYRSTDGGATWSRKYLGKISDIEVDPKNPARIYVSGKDHVLVSMDHGRTWKDHPDCIKGYGIHIHAAPASPSTVYVSCCASGLFKSEDGGGSWDTTHQGIKNHLIPALAVAPSRPETVFIDIYRIYTLMASYDSGGEWKQKTYPASCDTIDRLLVCSTDADVLLALEHG